MRSIGMLVDGVVVAIYEVFVTAADYHLAITELTLGYSAFLALLYHAILVLLNLVFPMHITTSFADKERMTMPFWKETAIAFLLAAHSVVACRASGLLPLISSELSSMWAAWNDAHALEGFALSLPGIMGLSIPMILGGMLNSLGLYYFVSALVFKNLLRYFGHKWLRPFSAESTRTQLYSLFWSGVIFAVVQHDLNVDHVLLHMSHKAQFVWFVLLLLLGVLHHFDAFYRRSHRRSTAERELAMEVFLREQGGFWHSFKSAFLVQMGDDDEFGIMQGKKDAESGNLHMKMHAETHGLMLHEDADLETGGGIFAPPGFTAGPPPIPSPPPLAVGGGVMATPMMRTILATPRLFRTLPPVQGIIQAVQQQPPSPTRPPSAPTPSTYGATANDDGRPPSTLAPPSLSDGGGLQPRLSAQSSPSPTSEAPPDVFAPPANQANSVPSTTMSPHLLEPPSPHRLTETEETRLVPPPVQMGYLKPNEQHGVVNGVALATADVRRSIFKERVALGAFRSLCLAVIGVEVYGEEPAEALLLSGCVAGLCLLFLYLREPPYFGTVMTSGTLTLAERLGLVWSRGGRGGYSKLALDQEGKWGREGGAVLV